MKNLSLSKGISILAIILIFSSCGQLNIQKRQYSGGWTIFSGKGVKSDPLPVRQHRKPLKATEQTAALPTEELATTAKTDPVVEISPYLFLGENATSPALNPIQKIAVRKIAKKLLPNLVTPGLPIDKTGKAAVLKASTGNFVGVQHGLAYDQVLLIILAILIPPLAVYFYEGDEFTDRVLINLILSILCWIPGVIHALIIILGNK